MFCVINLKNLRFVVLAALLFCLLTAIMVRRKEEEQGYLAVNGAVIHTLVIDAGHGGLDGGAVSVDGKKESEINLAIAKKLEFISSFLGIRTEMTRFADELPYPNAEASIREKKNWDQQNRLAVVRAADNPVFISIHQNVYPDPRPHGLQVLYAATPGSQEFGESVQGVMTEYLDPANRRVAMPISESIYLTKHIDCPGILVECGFLSNPAEAGQLSETGYQWKIAMLLAASYLAYTT